MTLFTFKVPKESEEYKFAEDALYTRHPSMEWWPKGKYPICVL